MKLIENYALKAGAKIDKPFIQTQFFPLTCEKYITINNSSQMPAKQYVYLGEVLNIIAPVLKENGINIIQLGDTNEPQYPNVIRLAGQTNLHQSAYIISNSLLHLGIDSFLTHCAAAFERNIVCLYSISPPSIVGPQFGQSDRHILLEPNFPEGFTYSQNPNEPQRLVNTIKVEKIVESVGLLLGISFPAIKTLHIAPAYNQTVIELIPDSAILAPAQFPGAIPIIRRDLGGIDQILFSQLQHRKCIVYIKNKIDINILSQLKGNVDRVVFEITELNAEGGARPDDLGFLKSVMSAGIALTTLTEISEEKTGLLKLDLSEHTIILQKPRGKRPENIQITDKTWGKSSKIICGNNNTYVSYYHYKKNLPIQNNSNVFKMVDDELLFSEGGDFLFIYDKE